MNPMTVMGADMRVVHDASSVDLRVLCAVHRHRSVTRAATELGCTQSAVSHTLRRLRDHFHDPLFVRVGRGMEPTPLGDRVVRGVEPHLHAIERVLAGPEAFEPIAARNVFTLASIDLFDALVLPPLLRRLGTEAPGVDLRVSTHRGDTVARFDRGSLDAAIHPVLASDGMDPLPTGGLRRSTLFRDGWMLFQGRGRPAADGLDGFCAQAHVLVGPGEGPGVVDHALGALGRRRRVALRLPNFTAALPVVAATELVMVGPASLERLVPEGVSARPLPLDLPPHLLTLVWPERLHDDGAHRWFRTVLAEVARGAVSRRGT